MCARACVLARVCLMCMQIPDLGHENQHACMIFHSHLTARVLIYSSRRRNSVHGHDAHLPLPDRVVYADSHLSLLDEHSTSIPAQRLWRMLKECCMLNDGLVIAHVNWLMHDIHRLQVIFESACIYVGMCMNKNFKIRCVFYKVFIACWK